MLNPTEFRELVIRPTLLTLDMWSPRAERLMIGTALAESGLRRLEQAGGPALGLYQMEPATHDDIWLNYFTHRPRVGRVVSLYCNLQEDKHRQLATNLSYATAMTRVHYWRVPEPLPEHLDGMGAYWKAHYNGPGKGTVEHFTAAYRAAFS